MAENADKSAYIEYAYTNLTNAIKEGKALLEANAAKEELLACYNNLLYWYTLTGEFDVNVAAGKPYTSNMESNSTYPDTGNKELTDGNIGDAVNTSSPTWAGYNGIAINSGKTYDIIVDLGENTNGLNKFTVNAHQQQSWGICVPGEITVYVSEDGEAWKQAATIIVPSEIIETVVPGGHTFTATATEAVSGRYVKYALTPVSQFVFISEVTAEIHYK